MRILNQKIEGFNCFYMNASDHDDDDVDDSSEEEEPPADSPAQEYMEYLKDMYFQSKLSAKDLCTSMWFLERMGHSEARPFALAPTSQSGKFQEKLNKAFDFKALDKQLYDIYVPLRSWRTAKREVQVVKAQPAHESVWRELDEDPGLLDRWRTLVRTEHEWVKQYNEHPLVVGKSLEEKETIMGGALYMDGAAFANRDSLFVFTIRLLGSRQRHLCFTLRKSNLCDCGCAGWCSFFSMFSYIAWSLQALKTRTYPASRHDGNDLDGERSSLAGKNHEVCVVICDILGDWKEFASSWGFPNWASLLPCFLCKVSKLQMLSPKCQVVMREDCEYHDECDACEVWVAISSKKMQQEIRLKLMTDSTRKGLCLTQDVNSTRPKLLKGDRLEPTCDFADVHQIEEMPRTFKPFTVLFWRARKTAVVHHRNPILSRELGLSYSMFAIDVLHCLHLGVFLVWITRVLHVLIEIDAFGTHTTRKTDHLAGSALAIKARLDKWYPRYQKSLSESAKRGMTKVNFFSDKMLGRPDMKKLVKLKAAEARHFMPFALDLLYEFRDQLTEVCKVTSLVRAGECLKEYMAVINEEPRKMSDYAKRKLVELQCEHNIQAWKAGVRMIPKHHQALSIFAEKTKQRQ